MGTVTPKSTLTVLYPELLLALSFRDAMTDKMNIWYYIEGKPAYFSVYIPPGDDISDLINEICKTVVPRKRPFGPHSNEGVLYHDLYVDIKVITNGLCWLMKSTGQ